MAADFPTLVGRFIHHCGALEFLTNNAIRALSRDDVLSAEVVRLPLWQRIGILRRLLEDRSKLDAGEVKSLCDELDHIRKWRNLVAHNPIVSEDPTGRGTQVILAFRHRPEGVTIPDKITQVELADFVARTAGLLQRFAELVPDATISPQSAASASGCA